MTTTATARTKAITDMFAAIDSGDYSTAFDYLADDITLVFSNAPAAHGKSAVKAALGELIGGLAGIRHEIHGLWHVDRPADIAFSEMTVTFTTPDGRATPVPCCDVFQFQGDHITQFRVYTDITPVFQPA